MKMFVFGSSIVSSYWNGAATYYRGLYKHLAKLGHEITFAAPDAYGRQEHRDAEDVSYVQSLVYRPGADVDAMLQRAAIADVVIKHSGLGADDELLEQRVLECSSHSIVCFWDVDAPATIARMQNNPDDPMRSAVSRYDAILTYGGGPGIRDVYIELGARAYYSIYNGLDADTHHPVPAEPELKCDVAFIGNRLPDREQRVENLFLKAAELAPDKVFLLGGEGWGDKPMPENVRWIGHVPTHRHNAVNCSAGMVMNINRSSMAAYGYAPPTRVFEVAGAGACMMCDEWPGIGDFFEPGKEILVIDSAKEVVAALALHDGSSRRQIGLAFHARALRDHAYAQRAKDAEQAFRECLQRKKTAMVQSAAGIKAMTGEVA
jgi:spore maturation protein CgeB